jgi:hypothetical protein
MSARFRAFCAILTAALLAATLSGPSAAEALPEGLEKAARDGLPEFLKEIPPGEIEHFGFHNPGELERATVGKPFLVHFLHAGEILGYSDGQLGTLSARATTQWEFPVLCDGVPRTLLTVDHVDGSWEAVGIGGLSPAPELEVLRERWPEDQGHELRYVCVLQTGSQFIQVVGKGVDAFVPVESTARALGILAEGEPFDYTPTSIDELVPVLAPLVRANIALDEE